MANKNEVQSGGVKITATEDLNIGGDVVGRDKITRNGQFAIDFDSLQELPEDTKGQNFSWYVDKKGRLYKVKTNIEKTKISQQNVKAVEEQIKANGVTINGEVVGRTDIDESKNHLIVKYLSVETEENENSQVNTTITYTNEVPEELGKIYGVSLDLDDLDDRKKQQEGWFALLQKYFPKAQIVEKKPGDVYPESVSIKMGGCKVYSDMDHVVVIPKPETK